jgi:hypothetical protein
MARWKQVLFGAIFQYVHGIFTQLAHRMHQPQEVPLGDIGFRFLPVSGSLPACLAAPRPGCAQLAGASSLPLHAPRPLAGARKTHMR